MMTTSRLPEPLEQAILNIQKEHKLQTDPEPQPEPAPASAPLAAEPAPAPEPVNNTPSPEPQANKPAPEPAPEPSPEPEPEPSQSWDSDLTPSTTSQVEYDFKKLGSALGLGEISTEAELVERVNQIKKQASEVKPKVKDAELQALIDLSEQGADWRAQVAEPDYAKLGSEDLKKLFEYQVSLDARYTKPDGSFDGELFKEDMDALPDATKIVQGRLIAQHKSVEQQQRRQAIESQNIAKREKFESQLTAAASKLSNLLPLEEYGIKFEPKHSSQLLQGFTDGSLYKELFYNDQGEYDAEKLVKIAAWYKWGPNMIKFMSNRAATQAKKDLLQKTQNPVLTNPKISSAPEPAQTDQPKSTVDKVKDYVSGLTAPGRL